MKPVDENIATDYDQLSEVQKYFVGRRILIADNSPVTRQSVMVVLQNLGATTETIYLAKNFAEAKSLIRKEKPSIVVTDYDLGDNLGLALCEFQGEYTSCGRDRLFVVLTKNSKQSAVAEAAEEDVDSYVLKPFSAKLFSDYFRKLVRNKLRPSEYAEQVFKGQRLLTRNEFDRAYQSFQSAVSMHSSPCLAHYYSAKCYQGDQRPADALVELDRGLALNPIHYKCLTLKIEILYGQKRYEDAYEVVKVLSKNFPVSSQRLGDVFTLAVLTHNFSDVEHYYHYFKQLDRKPDDLRRVVAAGLLVCGKSMLKNELRNRAIYAFTESYKTSNFQIQYFEKILQSLMAKKMYNEAFALLDHCPLEMKRESWFAKLEFFLLGYVGTDNRIIDRGRELIRDGKADRSVFETVAQKLVAQNKMDAAMRIIRKAIQIYPESIESFDDLYEQAGGWNLREAA
ncbi:MAG: hypothetical protein CL675_12660 [Bdellovibrionaceae bacterium]|nr:hypothetical protein [Pseudobdellovibrionaceae bacterium]